MIANWIDLLATEYCKLLLVFNHVAIDLFCYIAAAAACSVC